MSAEIEIPQIWSKKLNKKEIQSFSRDSSFCSINAFQLLGFLDEQTGDIFRMFVVFGIHPVVELQLFHYLQPHLTFIWSEIPNIKMLFTILESIPPNYIVHCSFNISEKEKKTTNVRGHSFNLIKSHADGIICIDPQTNTICNVSSAKCEKLLRGQYNDRTFYILSFEKNSV